MDILESDFILSFLILLTLGIRTCELPTLVSSLAGIISYCELNSDNLKAISTLVLFEAGLFGFSVSVLFLKQIDISEVAAT